MAKMFYTLDEAADRLKKSADEVKEMASSGQIQEFRDRDRLMFKVEQIDLLSADEDLGGDDAADLSSVIPLADSALLDPGLLGESALGESAVGSAASQSTPAMGEDMGASGSVIGLAGDTGEHGVSPGEGGSQETWDEEETSPNLSGTGSGLLGGLEDLGGSGLLSGTGAGGDTAERSGVGIFDADELDDLDPAAMTQMADGGGSGELNLENLGSGSGLMDLTRESDDTSLGAEFLEEVYPGDEANAGTGAAPAASGAGGGLFEGGEDEEEMVVGAGGGMVAAEPYDGAGSGLVGGLMVGTIAALALGIAFMILAVLGAPDGGLMDMVADKIMIVLGGLAGATVLLGGAGWAIGKRS